MRPQTLNSRRTTKVMKTMICPGMRSMWDQNKFKETIYSLQVKRNIMLSHFFCNIIQKGTAHFFFVAYVILFTIVIMNLLIGLAVSDINALMTVARRQAIISQIHLISDVMDLRNTLTYQYCLPKTVKKLFDR